MEKRSCLRILIDLAAIGIIFLGFLVVYQFFKNNQASFSSQIGSLENSQNPFNSYSLYPIPTNTPENQPYPSPGQTVKSIPISPCQFANSSVSEIPEFFLDNYSFSNPEIVLSSPKTIQLGDWLPDNQSILITVSNFDQNIQSIELLNPFTRELKVYSERQIINAPPIWLPEENAIAFTDMRVLDNSTKPITFSRQLWKTNGAENKELIGDVLESFYIASEPISDKVAYISDQTLSIFDGKTKNTQYVNFKPDEFKLSNGQPVNQPLDYEIAWRPNSDQLALYNENAFLITNLKSGEHCEVIFDGWADDVNWSPDGRFFAFVRSKDSIPVNNSEVAIIDATTGDQFSVQVAPDVEGNHFITDVAWGPDSRQLVVLSEMHLSSQKSQIQRGLYIVDFITGKNYQVLPGQSFGGGWWGSNLAWSQDGSKLLATCPTEKESRLCLIYTKDNNNP